MLSLGFPLGSIGRGCSGGSPGIRSRLVNLLVRDCRFAVFNLSDVDLKIVDS